LKYPSHNPFQTGSRRERKQKDGFIQVYIAKVQPQPAKMVIMLICAISSGEGGFGSARTKIHFIGEKL